MAAGRERSVGKNFTRPLKSTTKIVEDHIVVSADSAGIVDLCDNTVTPYAVTYRSTQDPILQKVGKEAFLLGSEIKGEIPLVRSGWVEVSLDVDHSAIDVGDMLIVGPSDNGRVVKGNPATALEFTRRVGWAEEKIAAPGGGLRTKATVLVSLDIKGGAP